MKHRRLLVYSAARERASTIQIRLVEPLRECGYELVHCGTLRRRAAELARVVEHEVDAVVVHREIKKHCKLYGTLLAAARACRKPVICDIDDLLIRVCQDHPDCRYYRAKTLYALKAVVDADLVLASTPTLARHLSPFHGAVTTVANRLPPRLWREICERALLGSRGRSDDCVTIGYIASDTHRPDLRHIEGAVTEVLRRYRGRVSFVSVGVPLTEGLRSLPWARQVLPPKSVSRDYTLFPQFAARFPLDIGIAPLADSPFNRSKSDVKFQEYAALGIPSVYAAMEPYRQRIRPGVNGFLAADNRQWVEHLSGLVDSAPLRRRIRRTAAREILRQWEVPLPAAIWDDIVERAAVVARAPQANATRNHLAPVVEQVLSYQAAVERQLKRTVEYQLAKGLVRLFRKWSA